MRSRGQTDQDLKDAADARSAFPAWPRDGSAGTAHRRHLCEGAFGRRALPDGVPMTLDTVFWIASMTKAITAVAAMQLSSSRASSNSTARPAR